MVTGRGTSYFILFTTVILDGDEKQISNMLQKVNDPVFFFEDTSLLMDKKKLFLK